MRLTKEDITFEHEINFGNWLVDERFKLISKICNGGDLVINEKEYPCYKDLSFIDDYCYSDREALDLIELISEGLVGRFFLEEQTEEFRKLDDSCISEILEGVVKE